MALTDINISEEFETGAPNMEVAQGSPEDFMTEDEMDPSQDPELQKLLESLPGEQAEVLMQLIKEFQEMVAQGFKGEFEDFVKMKMASAQGGSEEDFMTEEEMIVPDEELESMVPMGQQVAQGGRIGRARGGIMDVIEQEQIDTGPTPQQLIMKWLEDRNLPPTPENIQRAILEMSRGGQAPTTPRGEMGRGITPQMEMPIPPSGEGYVPEELIGEDITERVTPDVASMRIAEEVVPEEAGVTQQDDPIFYSDDERKEWEERGERLKSVSQGVSPDSYTWIMDDWTKEGVNKGWITQEDYLNYQKDFLGGGGELLTDRITDYRKKAFQSGGEVTSDTLGVMSQISPQEQAQMEMSGMAERALQKIWQEFNEKFPGIDSSNISLEEMVAMLQAEGVMDASGGILSLSRGLDKITPDSVARDRRTLDRHGMFEDELQFDFPPEPSHQFDHPVDRMRGRPGYGLGKIVKGIFKGFKTGLKGLTRGVKKFVKSDLGKAALMYMATAGIGSLGAGKGLGSLFKAGTYNPLTIGKNIGSSWTNLKKMIPKATSKLKPQAQVKNIIKDAIGMPQNLSLSAAQAAGIPATTGGSNFLSGLAGSFGKNPIPWITGLSGAAGLYTALNPGKDNLDELMARYKGEVGEWDQRIADIRAGKIKTPFSSDNITYPYSDYMNLADGGRVGFEEGGSTEQYSNLPYPEYYKLPPGGPAPTLRTGDGMLTVMPRDPRFDDDSNKKEYYTGKDYGPGDMAYTAVAPRRGFRYVYDQEGRRYSVPIEGYEGPWDDAKSIIKGDSLRAPLPYPDYYKLMNGGRARRAEGGLMDLGGLEKDYRAEGGFVPIGGKEKADDVPARLSRNEFVFTADAVRNAGGGDVDKGAEIMENVMTNLENGGSISAESQGLEGARDMFEVSERLSEVV